tara:strand:- start:104 stop:289 length:186 start_codon:yes stop_codon:yes gene_type:complete
VFSFSRADAEPVQLKLWQRESRNGERPFACFSADFFFPRAIAPCKIRAIRENATFHPNHLD